MKVLITGASSYLGARIYEDLCSEFDVVGTYNTNRLSRNLRELDVRDKDQTTKLAAETNPDFIIHVAAEARPGWCDEHREEASAVNELGVGNVVDAANQIEARLIYISSFTAINPTTYYGKTKRAGEDHARRTTAGFNILRPSFVVGYSPNTRNDRPFNRLLRDLRKKKPVQYDTSLKFQPTYLRHVSEVISGLIAKEILDETIAIAVPEVKSRFDLANDILSPFGISVREADYQDRSPVHVDDMNRLKTLGLPQYSYSEMIQSILEEIETLGLDKSPNLLYNLIVKRRYWNALRGREDN